jgi:hypothetical protein
MFLDHSIALTRGPCNCTGYTETAAALVRDYSRRQDVPPFNRDLEEEANHETGDLSALVEDYLDRQLTVRLGKASLNHDDAHADAQGALDVDLSGPLPQRVTATLRAVHATNILSVGHAVLPRQRFDTTRAEWM